MTGDRARRSGWRLGVVSGSAVLVLLLVLEVVSPLPGIGALYVAAWLVIPTVVGFKNMPEAGCFYMLVSLGILLVVNLAGQAQVPV